MAQMVNVQQEFDAHVFGVFDAAFGRTAPGDDWINNPADNIRNKYAVVREYRLLQVDEVIEIVKGRTQSNLGAVIITNTRLVMSPRQIKGRKYNARFEMQIYNACLNIRQVQLKPEARVTYEINRDVIQALIDNPFYIGGQLIPIQLQTTESELSNQEMDTQRIIASVPFTEMNR